MLHLDLYTDKGLVALKIQKYGFLMEECLAQHMVHMMVEEQGCNIALLLQIRSLNGMDSHLVNMMVHI